ncbi:MAG TPA: UDP-N-acetylmuramyl-tripeptide synthetase [Candidatus Paceibacterota bacterium]|nr:UDP-N-acetylmuramyl-tripeptide synthetase [Candidatus Paceibacterota bacterium]
MEKILRKIEKFIPKKIFTFAQPAYHYLLTLTGAIIYRFPARKLFVIGVTGTKGKSTTTEIINAILEEAEYKTALSNTIRFKIDDKSVANKYKMSMPGRFFMQKFLRDAIKNNCTHAVVEITSEGSKQFRHKFIGLDAFVFTNLAREHIESHGSYEKYREAKLKIADNLAKKKGIMVVNSDDAESEHFLNRVDVTKKIKFSLTDAKPINFGEKTEMRFGKSTLYSPLLGEFNVYNILAAATLAREIGISEEIIKKAVENLTEIPGRAQKVIAGQNFDVIVDYAHTPESLTELYKAFPNKRKICILGNTGGGRDKWKRPVMAKIAEQYCDEIILTNEDPYNEDPFEIVREMRDAISDSQKLVKIIIDRREAIKEALSRAKKDTVVLISGKGTDPYIMGADGEKTPWSDYNVAKEEIEKILK